MWIPTLCSKYLQRIEINKKYSNQRKTVHIILQKKLQCDRKAFSYYFWVETILLIFLFFLCIIYIRVRHSTAKEGFLFLTVHCQIRFTHAFSTLHVAFWKYKQRFINVNGNHFQTQCNVENARINRMWQLGFTRQCVLWSLKLMLLK